MVHISIHLSTQAAQVYNTFLGLSTHFDCCITSEL